MQQEKSRAISFEFIGGKDVMPIGGYFGPYYHEHSQLPNYFTDEVFQMIRDAGLNLIVYSLVDYASTTELAKTYLELGEKYGIGLFVTDNSVVGNIGNDNLTGKEIKEKISAYAGCKAFCGMYLVDEPQTTYYLPGDGSKLLPKYKRIAEVLNQELGISCYSNLNPIQHNNKEAYERYVEDYCDTLKPKMLSWDYYPFDKYREGKMEVYFYNMDLIRRTAQKRNLPFWAIVQAGAQWNDTWDYFDSELPYYPNEPQFNWNVNTCLAFGVQGIQYFPLIQPYQFTFAKSTEGDYERNGIVGAMCNKTQWYYYAQNINKHIATIDEVLMNAVHKGIIISGEQAKKDMSMTTCVIEEGVFRQLRTLVGDAMVGCFDYQGKTALYVVNYSFESTQQIVLKFADVQNIKIVKNAKISQADANELQLNMAAGEGILLVLE